MWNVNKTPAFLAILLVAACVTTSAAQPVLTADNTVLPLLGQEISISEFHASSPGSLAPVVTATGANMVWDLSGADFGTAVMVPAAYPEPPFSDLPGAGVTAFENANYALSIVGLVSEDLPEEVEIVNYNVIDDSQLINLGFAAWVNVDEDDDLEEVVVTYDPADLEMIFPLTMGSKWESESAQTFHVEGLGSFPGPTVKIESEVVGWGTLVTPAGEATVLQIDQDFTASSFGIVSLQTRSIQFFGPLQETAGKGAVQGIVADVQFAGDGSLESVSYSVFEAEGGAPTASEDFTDVPVGFRLHQNYPNPFNPATTIPFSLERSGHALMTVHDVLGREIAVVVDGVVSEGHHSVTWEADAHPSGLYQVRLSVDGQIRTRSMLLQK